MRRIIIAACRGAAVFIEFAAVECFFASIIPWMILPRASYAPVFRDATIAFIAIYAALGALAGGIVAFASERMEVQQAGVSLVLVVIFLGNAMGSLQRGAFLLAELVAVVAAIVILRGMRHRRPSSAWSGWALGCLLLFPFWASQEMFPAPHRSGNSCAGRRARSSRSPWSSRRSLPVNRVWRCRRPIPPTTPGSCVRMSS